MDEKHEIRDYLDAQLEIIHELRKEGIKVNGIYIRESPVPISAITREFVISKLCGPRLQDSAGGAAAGASGVKVTEAKSGTKSATLKPTRALLVDVEATHEGLTKNYTYYTADNLEKSAKTWIEPYQKPVIIHHRNHDFFVPAEDPIGRVVAYEFTDSVLKPGTKTIKLRHRITDPDAQQKIIDRRYITTSIGGIAESIHCSICGVNRLETWCDHRRGQKYTIKKDENSPEEEKLCYWIVGKLWYEEDSYVNTPADEAAQVIHFEWEDEAGGGRRESRDMDTEKDILEIMDELTVQSQEDTAETNTESTETAAAESTEEVKESDSAGTATENSTETAAPTAEEQLAAAQAEIADLKRKLAAAEEAKALAEADAASARQEVEEANAAKAKAEQELAVANAEIKQLTEKARALARSLRQTLIDRVVDLKIAIGEAKEEDRAAVVESLAGKTGKELQQEAAAVLSRRPARAVMQVTSPGQIAAGDVEEKVGENPKELGLDDLVESFLTAMHLRNDNPLI